MKGKKEAIMEFYKEIQKILEVQIEKHIKALAKVDKQFKEIDDFEDHLDLCYAPTSTYVGPMYLKEENDFHLTFGVYACINYVLANNRTSVK